MKAGLGMSRNGHRGRGGRVGVDAWRAVARRFLLAGVVVLLGACDVGLGTRGGLVHNSTTRDLVVEVAGQDHPYRVELPAQASGQWNAPDGECLGTGVAIYALDAELITTLDERICYGRTLRIEDEDLVAQPLPARAQDAPPPEAASIRIDEAQVLPDGEGVSLPVNLAIDPEAGIDEGAALGLVVDLRVNAEPLAGAPVAVSATDTMEIETDADGRVEVSPQDLGSWSELTSPDGVDFVLVFDPSPGGVDVTIQLVVEDGDQRSPLWPVTTRSFDVEADGVPLVVRIEQDYRDGVITADDAARYSLLSAIDAEYRAEPYVELYDDDIPDDPQALGLFAVTLFPEISDETRAELEAYFTVDDPPGR